MYTDRNVVSRVHVQMDGVDIYDRATWKSVHRHMCERMSNPVSNKKMKISIQNALFRTMLLLWILLLPGISRTQGPSAGSIRKPAVAGSFYPASGPALESALDELFEQAERSGSTERVQCLIVPHAGYAYSGVVAASGYLTIPPEAEYKNIFIIASSHREQFNGASVYTAGDYSTPLGTIPVNRKIGGELAADHSFIDYIPGAHDREHSIEVQLPFIQVHLRKLPPVIPIVIGSPSVSVARDLASALLPYFNPDNLFIISSDFSHYPEYSEAVRIDRITGEAIMKNDPEIFYNSLRQSSREPVRNLATPCCSWSAVLTLLYMSSREGNLEFSPVIYRNSGDAAIGDKDRVVGYWAITGHRTSGGQTAFSLKESERRQLVHISRSTLESYLLTGQLPSPPETITPVLQARAGAFVSLYAGGRLRGCIGNFFSDKPLYQVVQEMTLAAATRDHRFAPVEAPELPYIRIEISVLTPLQKINGIEEFIPGRHGIYMTRDGKSGTYLPQVAEKTGWSAEEMLAHCAGEKAMIGPDGWKKADLFVYEAIVFGEEEPE